MKRYKSVDAYVDDQEQWRDEIARLREILCATGLEETVKWGMPVYTFNGKNVAGIGTFNNYFGLWFYQGALLQDEKEVLINAQEGRTKALRQWRMTGMSDIKPRIINSYVKEAIAHVAAGKNIKANRSKPIVIPPELKKMFDNNRGLQNKFGEFGVGKQREFADYVSDAKRVETRQRRVEKIVPMILDGVGLNDKYR